MTERLPIAGTNRTLAIALLRGREAVMERFRPLLNAHAITEQQWRVLRVLYEAGPLDATLLASEACLLAPSLTRMLRALNERGLISQRADPADKRRNLICLTPEGEAFIAAVAPESARIYSGIEAQVGADRIETLLNEINALLAALADDRGGKP